MALFTRKPKAVVAGAAGGGTGGGVVAEGATDEGRVREIGSAMLALARGHKAGPLSAKFYSDKLMSWSMSDQNLKVQLFRFVDVFPMLRTPEEVYEHLRDYLSQPGVTVPAALGLSMKAGGIAKGLAASTISSQIKSMASKFIAGTDAASALPNLEKLWKSGIAFSVDLLGEACVSEEEADAYRDKYLDLVRNLPATAASWPADARLERDHLGAIPRTNVSIKISSLSAKCDPIDTEGSIRDLMRRIEPILEAARDAGVLINFDMEQRSLKDLTIELFKRCCERIDFAAGIAIQAYLRSGVADARNLSEWARAAGKAVTVRLVKGAYWDYEVIHAEQQGWPCPVWPEKRLTDACFEQMTDVFLDACPRRAGEGGIKLALGSHNVRSIAYALAGLERRGLPGSAIELQMLHGMADSLKLAAAELGFGGGTGVRVREYVPVGELIPGMAYLVRRLLENTSNESWLKAGFLEGADEGVLLASPKVDPARHAAGNGAKRSNKADLSEVGPERHALSPAVEGLGDGRAFFNEPPRDFSQKPVREAFAAAVARAAVPAVANDRTPEDAARMVAEARRAFLGEGGRGGWRDADPMARAGALVRAAGAMRSRRDELSGVMVKESGKSWREADADVCEAIDFCEYYARMAVGMFRRERMGRFIGELDEQWYQARGVAVVISPWNFPLAICTGMTAAALVMGNSVVVKPAEQTPGIAKLMHEILVEAVRAETGMTGVLQFCAAPGETTGAALVRDPRVALIAFTGSKAVGLDIVRAAGETPEAQQSPDGACGVKKVVCEMGGKNAIIVDTSADLDEAVLGVRHSAFGFQGQKCSACSRCIVVDPQGPRGPAITHFVQRLLGAMGALVVGDPAEPGTDVGPVIDEEARGRIEGYVRRAAAAGLEVVRGNVPEGLETGVGKPFVAPTIVLGVLPEHELAREEVFGPVLAVMHAGSFDEALAMASASPYKLTGGLFSRKPAHIERAKRELRVGNLYINRGITGALVARQPFGGFGMSGVGSKAGGRDYLLQFVEPRASCENTMRRGFAPEL